MKRQNRRRQRRSDCRRYFEKQAERKMFRIRRDGKKRQRKKRAGLSETHKMRAPRKPRNRGGRVLVKGGGKAFRRSGFGRSQPQKGDNGNRKSRRRRRHSRRGRKTVGRSAENSYGGIVG